MMFLLNTLNSISSNNNNIDATYEWKIQHYSIYNMVYDLLIGVQLVVKFEDRPCD